MSAWLAVVFLLAPPVEPRNRNYADRESLLAMSRDGALIACASGTGVTIRDAEGATTAIGHVGSRDIRQLTDAQGGWVALVASYGETRVILGRFSGQIVGNVPLPRPATRVAADPDSKRFAVLVPSAPTVEVWDMDSKEPLATFEGPDASTRLHALGWSVGDPMWLDYRALRLGLRTMPVPEKGAVDVVASGARLFIASWSDRTVRRSGPGTAAISGTQPGHPFAMATRPDSDTVLVALVSEDPLDTRTKLVLLQGGELKPAGHARLETIPSGLDLHPTRKTAYTCDPKGNLGIHPLR